jgi:hypothetical protein
MFDFIEYLLSILKNGSFDEETQVCALSALSEIYNFDKVQDLDKVQYFLGDIFIVVENLLATECISTEI